MAFRGMIEMAAEPEGSCIFTGVGARHVLELGVAHRATFAEAVAHVDRAAELGLMGSAPPCK